MPPAGATEVLRRETADGIIGRDAELELLLSSLNDAEPWVWFIHGIAGIGKSTLLRALAGSAGKRRMSVHWLDASSIEPTPAGLLGSLSRQCGRDLSIDSLAAELGGNACGTAIVIDHYESITLLDSWVRETLVPSLSPSVKLFLAAREAPAPGWRLDPRCNMLLRALGLKALDRPAAEQLLARFGLEQDCAHAIRRAAAGHPLALVLAAGKLRDRVGAMTDVLADVNFDLARAYLSGIEDKGLLEAIEAASVVRRVTTRMLSMLLPQVAASEYFVALRNLPFVDAAQDGLQIHELVRTAVAGTLELSDPSRYRRYQRAAWRCLKSDARQCPRVDMWRYTADMIYLLRNPVIREAFFPSAATGFSIERAQPSDIEDVAAMVQRHEPQPVLEVARAWLAGSRSSFLVVRNRQNRVVGFHWTYDPERVDAALIERDPVARAWLDHCRGNSGPTAKRALFIRRWLSDEHGEAPSAAQAAAWLDMKRIYMEMRPALRWVYLTLTDPAPFARAATELGFVMRDDARIKIGDRVYHTAILDMGPESFDGWISRLLEAEIGSPGAHVLDERSRRFLSDEVEVQLSPLEFSVMQRLYARDGLPASRDELIAEVWGEHFEGESNVVDAVIREIRRKLGPRAKIIKTVRGIGYSLHV